MIKTQINPKWPNQLRWLLVQNLHSFTPWHFIREPNEFSFAEEAFKREDVGNRQVFVFASRQDNDDYAGLEIKDNKILEKVLYFHLGFQQSSSKWNIVKAEHADVFDFLARKVVPDMRDWALTDDAYDLEFCGQT